jgi:hypothetical protein
MALIKKLRKAVQYHFFFQFISFILSVK